MTTEEVEAEYWRHYYYDLKASGKGEEIEDEDLDIDALVQALEDGDESDWEQMINDVP